MNDLDLSKPILLYGSNISYFTGKMENYFRVKEISYEQKLLSYPRFERTMKKKVGIHQMPAVELPDGRWMTDTTKMIQWFESKIPENKIIPEDPVKAFFALSFGHFIVTILINISDTLINFNYNAYCLALFKKVQWDIIDTYFIKKVFLKIMIIIKLITNFYHTVLVIILINFKGVEIDI